MLSFKKGIILAFAGFSLVALSACDGEDVAEAPEAVVVPEAEAPEALPPATE